MTSEHTPPAAPSAELDAAAAQWVARADRGALTPEDTCALEQWLAQSSRHRGAYARAQAAFAYMNADVAAAVRRSEAGWAPPQAAADATLSRRRLLWVGAAGAAAAAVTAIVAQPDAPAVTYNAQRGEIRMVSLADGSIITLDTSSSVTVQFLKHSRNITLDSGRALFNVAKDKMRPFVVTAGGLKVRAVGTAFAVRRSDVRPSEVLVQEGLVDVGQNSEKAPIRVGANMRVVALGTTSAGLHVQSMDPAAVARELSWRQGLLAFEDVSLMSAAAEFARYSDMEIVIRDPKVGNVTITGVFSATNPLGFARAAALSLGLKIDVSDRRIRLDRT